MIEQQAMAEYKTTGQAELNGVMHLQWLMHLEQNLAEILQPYCIESWQRQQHSLS